MKNKTFFVDFDDTICLHKKEILTKEYIFENIEEACEKYYKNSFVNKKLYDFLVQKQKAGDKIILLSSACSKMLEVKKYWLHKNCAELNFEDFISVSIDINKSEIMTSYIKYYKLKTTDIVFIDDLCQERWTAEKIGIETYNPQLIMNDNFKE